jgi:hypothetical protein
LILSKKRGASPLPSLVSQVPKETEKNLLLDMNMNDELASIALGFKSESKKVVPQENVEISIRYSKSQLLNIFKKMGNYVHPADQLSYFDVPLEKEKETMEVLDLITDPQPDIMLELLKDHLQHSIVRPANHRHFSNERSSSRGHHYSGSR